MPHVRIEASPLGPAVEVDDPAGGRLLDLCDEVRAPVPFSCRGASCGTCRVDVLEGAELLDPPSTLEREVLDLFGDPPGRRLACIAVVKPGSGRLRLKVTDDEV